MCMRTIIDACAFRHFCVKSKNTAGHQLRRWIENGDGLVVYTEALKYGEELKKYTAAHAFLNDFRQAGRAELIKTPLIEAARDGIPDLPIRRSDDPHVLALAAAGEATVLFSCDSDLQNDFSNNNVLSNVGHKKRRSVPLKVEEPYDTTETARRRQFFATRRCAAPR